MRRRTIAGLVAAVAAVALVVGVSVVWPGSTRRRPPDVDTSVWALQTGGRAPLRAREHHGRRARHRPQHQQPEPGRRRRADGAFLFSDSYSKLTRIDEALPVDLDEEALRASPSHAGGHRRTSSTAGDFVAYRTDSGAVFVGRLSTARRHAARPVPVR